MRAPRFNPARRTTVLRLLASALTVAALPAGQPLAQQPGALVAAASDLQFALTDVRARYLAQTGRDVRLSFGSSGNITRQIRSGAPFEIFMSADESYIADLERAGLTRDAGRLYAIGRLALMVPHGSPLRPDASLADLAAAVADGRLGKLAIANPAHAPYGRAAREVLQGRGLWEKLSGRLVLGENVSQAVQFAASGAAQAALIAQALAIAPPVAKLGQFALIPEDWHAPLRQRMVLTRNAGVAAEQFFAYLQGPEARAILARYGFSLPAGPG